MVTKDEIKDRVLTENTAQGILNHLRELESNRARMQRRWIWELLQNARDASAVDDSLDASIELGDGELVFEHNGRGFAMEEVAHLIYHGSTKLEDQDAIGQYGSGFLTTHLLSPEIDVSGQLRDGRSFNFSLKREISSAKALSDSMDKAWREFDASGEAVSGGFTTRFRYPMGEDSAMAVTEGIETLRRCAPFVVVFNRQFRRISIKTVGETSSFEVVERVPLDQEGLQRVTVGVSDHGILKERSYVLANGVQASIATPIQPVGDGSSCLPLEDVPRLFLGFPLIGTEDFSFPAVINSFQFTPTENRDGVYLGQSEDAINHTNQAVVAEACDLLLKLIGFVAKSRWTSIHMLASIPPISSQTWLNDDWLQEQLRHLVERMRETPSVLCGEEPAAPKDAILPFVQNGIGVETLWDLLDDVEDLRQMLPSKDEATGWQNVVESWALVADCEATSFGEAFDGGKLVPHIEEKTEDEDPDNSWGTIEKLQSLLVVNACAVEWLDRLYAFLKDDSLDNLIREHCIVLDQVGCLDKLTNLYRDLDVDNGLKHIADDLLGLNVRDGLRDKRLTALADDVGKGDYETKDISQEILERLQELCDEDELTDDYARASAHMLGWVVGKEEWNYLMGFPAFSASPEDGSRRKLWLGQQGGEDADIPLAPVKAWPEDLQEFAGLFPWGHILADAFFDVMPEPDIWRVLNERGYVQTDVVINRKKISETSSQTNHWRMATTEQSMSST